jgi:protoporphyrinogen oxidase
VPSSRKIVIVGAGIGGLASGHFLREAGRDVDIYERAPVPGGRIQLLEKGGSRVDVGTQYFHTNYLETLKLLSALDLEDKLLPIRAPVMLMRNGRGFLAKHNTLRYKLIPLISNLKFGRLIWTTLRNFTRLDPYHDEPLEDFEGIDLAEYVLQRCDEEVLEFLVRPIITAFNLSDPEGESLAHFLRIAKQLLTSSDTCLPTGMFTLPETLAKRLPVTYDAEVLEIQTQSNRVTGVRLRLGGETKTIAASDIVCATPLKELPRLLPILTDEEKAVARDFTYSEFPLAVFFMKRRLSANHWAYVFSRTEGFKASFTSDAVFKCGQMIPSGKSVLQVWFAGEAGAQLVDESHEDILALAREEMTRIIPNFAEEVESIEVVRHHTGMPRYRVGIYPRLRGFLKSIGRIDGLHLVGDYYGHSTIETVVRSARRAAGELLAPRARGADGLPI